MILVDNFVHSDLHPGNIMVQLDVRDPSSAAGESDSTDFVRLSLEEFSSMVESGDDVPSPRLVYLDAGLTTRLSKNDMYVVHLTTNNYVEM